MSNVDVLKMVKCLNKLGSSCVKLNFRPIGYFGTLWTFEALLSLLIEGVLESKTYLAKVLVPPVGHYGFSKILRLNDFQALEPIFVRL